MVEKDEVTTGSAGKEPETSKISDYHLRSKLADYGFGINMIELVVALKNMGDNVRWPKEMWTDLSKQI